LQEVTKALAAAEPEPVADFVQRVGGFPTGGLAGGPVVTEPEAPSTVGSKVDASGPPVGSQERRMPFGCDCLGANTFERHLPGCEHDKPLPLPPGGYIPRSQR
jgi:hypothetical protein